MTTLAHAITKTATDAAASSVPARDIPAVTSGVIPVYGSTAIISVRLRVALSAVCSAFGETPGRRRPRAQNTGLDGSAAAEASGSGIQTSTGSPT